MNSFEKVVYDDSYKRPEPKKPTTNDSFPSFKVLLIMWIAAWLIGG